MLSRRLIYTPKLFLFPIRSSLWETTAEEKHREREKLRDISRQIEGELKRVEKLANRDNLGKDVFDIFKKRQKEGRHPFIEGYHKPSTQEKIVANKSISEILSEEEFESLHNKSSEESNILIFIISKELIGIPKLLFNISRLMLIISLLYLPPLLFPLPLPIPQFVLNISAALSISASIFSLYLHYTNNLSFVYQITYDINIQKYRLITTANGFGKTPIEQLVDIHHLHPVQTTFKNKKIGLINRKTGEGYATNFRGEWPNMRLFNYLNNKYGEK